MRMNISVPDELAEQVRARDLPISSICQDALRKAVDLAEKKEQIMTDMQAVVERLRATQNEERQRHIDEGRELGILWAKQYATADELRQVAEGDGEDYERGIGSGAGIAEFYQEVENNYDEEYQEEHNDAFVEGAREVWEAVKHLL
ncbi:type II toxin-antitoxin system CcdA family antitoxin [Streptomyces sp. NPDC001634]|uniref:type II toxin-antitoxin system CcdA family antitoxin n=1 Tax=Streptomyces sp. NPDC001634 TaxID=3154390 RepID=UPI00331DFBB6